MTSVGSSYESGQEPLQWQGTPAHSGSATHTSSFPYPGQNPLSGCTGVNPQPLARRWTVPKSWFLFSNTPDDQSCTHAATACENKFWLRNGEHLHFHANAEQAKLAWPSQKIMLQNMNAAQRLECEQDQTTVLITLAEHESSRQTSYRNVDLWQLLTSTGDEAQGVIPRLHVLPEMHIGVVEDVRVQVQVVKALRRQHHAHIIT